MADFVIVAKREDLHPGEGMQVDVNGQKVALFNSEGEYYAMDSSCPHAGGPLADGYLEKDTVVCPWHAWEFNVKTGACKLGVNQKTYAVKIEGEDVLVSTDSDAADSEQEPDEDITNSLPKDLEEPTGVDPQENVSEKENEDSGYVRVASLSEFSDEEGKLVDLDGYQIAFFKVNETIYAMDDICPHMGGPLSQGWIEGDCVVCPWHAWQFNLKNGEAPTGMTQKTFPVRVENNEVYVRIDSK